MSVKVKKIIKIGHYLRKLCSNEQGSSFLTHSVTPWMVRADATWGSGGSGGSKISILGHKMFHGNL